MMNDLSRATLRQFILCTLSLCVSIFYANAVFAQSSPDIVLFTEPHGSFTINKPVAWHVLQMPHVGQRVTILSKQKRTLEELQSPYDPEAELTIKLYRMNQDDMQMTRQALAERYLNFLKQIYMKQFNLELKIEHGADDTFNGLTYSTAHTICEDTVSDMWITAHNGIFVELKASYIRKTDDPASSVLQAMARSFRMPEQKAAMPSTVIKAKSMLFQFAVPAAWSIKRYDNESAEQLFISREKVVKPEDMFQVGISVNIFKDVRKVWNLDDPLDPDWIMNAWMDISAKSTQKNNGQFFAVELTKLGELPMLKFEHGFQGSEPNVFIHAYHVTILKNETLIDIVLEAPVMEFENYRPTFDRAIQTLQLNSE